MRKPRQVYTDEESKEIDVAAQRAFEQTAGGGIFLPWKLCREMAELKFWLEQVKEIREEVEKIKGK